MVRARFGPDVRIFVAYADCGTGGTLDAYLEREGLDRIEGAHCFEFYAGAAAYEALQEEELGTFYLTDFLARQFDSIIMAGLGLDRHPELLPMYFGNYRRLVYLAQTDDAELTERARAAADRLGLAFERRRHGVRGPRHRPSKPQPPQEPPDMPPMLSIIWWRDIPAQVVAKDARRSSKVVLHPRFQVAIDKAANRAGKREYNSYIAEWRKTFEPCGDDLEAEVRAESERLEAALRQAPPRRADPDRRRRRRSRPAAGHDLGGLADMTDTVLVSASREVVIGFDRPFVIIGERINPTGRKLLAEEMKAGDFSRVERDVLAQVEAGAHMLDVNAGIPLADEPAILARTIQLVQSLTDLPLSIDSSIVEALEAGLAVYQGKPLLNSVTGEEERLERVLPLVRKYGAAVVAISNDDTGISMDPDVRFAVAKRIVERAADHGIPRSDIVVDPLVMPIGALAQAGQQVFALVRRLREELKVNTTCGASNVSFGLPNREGINAAFLPMAIAAGMTSAITNPLMPEVKACVMAADVLMGHDPDCGRWITAHRVPTPEGEVSRRRVNRRAVAVG